MKSIWMGCTLQYMHEELKDLKGLQTIVNTHERKELTEEKLVYFVLKE